MLRPPLSPTLSTNAASFSVLLILIQVAACGGWVVVRDTVAEQETNTKGGPLGDPGHRESGFRAAVCGQAWFFLIICYP